MDANRPYVVAQPVPIALGQPGWRNAFAAVAARRDAISNARAGMLLPRSERDAAYELVLRFAGNDPTPVPDIGTFEEVISDVSGSSDILGMGHADLEHPYDDLTLEIVRFDPAQGDLEAMLMAGPRGVADDMNEMNNCVMRTIMHELVYYKECGNQRAATWDKHGHKLPYLAALRKMRRNVEYKRVADGMRKFRDWYASVMRGYTQMALDFRMLVTLAEMCDITVRVHMFPVAGRFNVNSHAKRPGGNFCRFDTAQEYGARSRLAFDLVMTSNRHVVAMPRQGNGKPAALPLQDKEIKLCSDMDFDRMLAGERHLTPESDKDDHRQILMVLKSAPYSHLDDSVKNNPESDPAYHGGKVLTDDRHCYMHRQTAAWLLRQHGDSGDLYDVPKHVAPHEKYVAALYAGLNETRVRQVSQRIAPRTYYAVTSACHMPHFCGTYPDNVPYYVADVKHCFGADFKTTVPEYFNGYPTADVWEEFECRRADGGMLGDAPYDFKAVYSIMLIDSLDFTRAHPGIRDTMVLKFKGFGGELVYRYDPDEDKALFLHSPIVHFLADHGVEWRCSKQWVCRPRSDTWMIGVDPETAKEASEGKFYSQMIGSMSAGRKPMKRIKFWAPDGESVDTMRQFFMPNGDSRVSDRRFYTRNTKTVRPINDAYPTPLIADQGYIDDRGNIGYYSQVMSKMRVNNVDGGMAIGNEVTVWDDIQGHGKTMCHVSGAVYAYAFASIWRGIIRIPTDLIHCIRLDSAVCTEDPSDYLAGLIDETVPGMFKRVEAKPPTEDPYTSFVDGVRVSSAPPLNVITETFSPVVGHCGLFPGGVDGAKPYPLWSDSNANRTQFSFLTGEAGSGKTVGSLSGEYLADSYLGPDTVYCTFTNHLARVVRSKFPNTVCTTVHKMFNRRVADDKTFTAPRDRFTKGVPPAPGVAALPPNFLSSKAHTIFVDEASYLTPDQMEDVLETCSAYNKNVVFALDADLGAKRFFQLKAPKSPDESEWFSRVNDWFTSRSISPPSSVHIDGNRRQMGDLGLLSFVRDVRERRATIDDIKDRFATCTYDEMCDRIDPSRDLVVCPFHAPAVDVYERVFARLSDDCEVPVRAGEKFGIKDAPDFLHHLAVDGDKTVLKGAIGRITFGQLKTLKGTKYMPSWPYFCGEAGDPDANLIQPMITSTAYKCQGITLDDPESVLYILPEEGVDFNFLDPNTLYVAVSRCTLGRQLVYVTRGGPEPDARPPAKRVRYWAHPLDDMDLAMSLI